MINKKKVGILTFHSADNYGACLQAYALSRVIKKLEYKVELINYFDPYIKKGYSLMSISNKNFFKGVIKNIIRICKGENKRKKIFADFRSAFFNYSIHCNSLKEIINIGYDAIVVGSDQVWNPKLIDYNKTYFLYNDKGINTISYAASFGKSEFENDEIQFILNNIKSIKHISVREDSGVSFLKNNNIDSQLVLDPTLLLKKDDWNELIDSYSSITRFSYKNKKYVFVYRMTYNEKLIRTAYQLAEKYNLEIILLSVFDKPEYFKGINQIYAIGPVEFLKYIKNAEYVITDSFHGLVFSIIFQKNFFTLPHKQYGTRTLNLLKMLSLEKQMDIENFEKKIDYNKVNNILKQYRKKSIVFLKESLDEIKDKT